MNTNPLFLELNQCAKKIIVLQGGGDAGKTVTALQRIAQKSMLKRNQISTVTGQTIPSVKAGALRSFQRYVLPDFQKYITNYNSTERTYTFWNGSVIEFKSFQDELGARGSERDNLFMNECNAETYETFWQLQRKTRDQVILDYNPTSPFWVHYKVLPLDIDGKPNTSQERQFFNKVQLYIVDHRHNMFLTEEEHQAYETISDPDMFRVYSRGLTGKIRGLVFGHFRKWADAWPTDVLRTIWGLDYGYTTDPTALLKIAVGGDNKPKRRVAKELSYEPGLTAEHIKNILTTNGLRGTDIIYSEADPNMINQLRTLGMPVYPAIKGPGSIAAGISKVREHECYYTADSLNFEKELQTYKFLTAQDIITGKEITTNQPIDAWNHCCDAFRYADYTDSFKHR
jgi:phage terminase large subunit